MGAAKYSGWCLSQWPQVGRGGLPIIQRKMRIALRCVPTAILFMLNAVWAIPAVLLVRAAQPLAHVRMGVLISSRIGHFVKDASIFLARRSLQSQRDRTIDLFWFPKRTCNEQWARMVRRKLFVRWWARYMTFFNRLIPGGRAYDLPLPTGFASRRGDCTLQKCTVRFEITSKEAETAKAWLHHRGWQDDEYFVCLLARDSAYLSTHPLHSDRNSEGWSYHNYRDSDIATYVETVQALVDKGYWVIRMGKTMNKRLSLQHERVIDYPFVEDQDDLLDIWLSVNCRFFISTSTGIDMVPWVYGRPVVYVNALPLACGAFPVNHIWVPKHLYWKEDGRPLTLKEHCQHRYFLSKEYEEAGIVIEDLSAEEIKSAVMECEQRVAGTWVETAEDQERQRRYWKSLRDWPDFHKLNGDVHPEARVGCAWLKSMGHAFLE